MALAIPAEDEKTTSLLNVYDVFAPTTKPLCVRKCPMNRRVSHALAVGLVPFSVLWHPTLNQMVVGMKDGSVHVLYDPSMSVRGAVMIEGRKETKKKEMAFGNLNHVIYSPAPNDDDMRKSDDVKRRDNKPGKPDPLLHTRGITSRYAAPYREMLHSGGATTWSRSDPATPATGIPMSTGGGYLTKEDIKELSGIDVVEVSREFGVGPYRRHESTRGVAEASKQQYAQ